tara:strand:- start:1745 stop:1921 length:177 start_codon:yes stop_codon:yes gene_type:complete
MSNGDAISFFHSIPDDVLVDITLNNWDSLEALCIGYTLDLHLMNEGKNENISNRRNVC